MSIKRKIIGLFVLLAVIPIIVGIVFAGQYKALVQERALIRLDAAASNLKERMGLVHKLNSERLAGITSRTHLRLSLARFLDSADPQDQVMMRRILEDALESIPTFKRIQILDTSGTEVVSTGQPVEADVSALVRDAESMGFRHSQFRIGPEGDWELLMMGPLTLLERRIGVAVLFSGLSDVLAEAANDAYLQNSGEVLLAVRDDKSEPRLLGRSFEPNDLTTPSSGEAMLPVIDAIQG